MNTKQIVKLTQVERRAAQVELVKGEGGGAMLSVGDLPPAFQVRAEAMLRRTSDALAKFGRAGLQLGAVLLEARELFKPVGLWLAFLHKVPGLSLKTGDRLIKRYEMARKVLPELVLAVALSTGVALAGDSDDKPYGKYTGAAKRVGGPPRATGEPVKDMERARSWVAQVVTARAGELRRVRSRQAKVAPVDQAAQTLARKAQAQGGETAEAQAQYVREVTIRALKLLGSASATSTLTLLKREVAQAAKAA